MCRTFAGQRPIPLAARILFSHTLLIPYFFHDVRDTIPTIPIPISIPIPIPFEIRPHCSLGSETAFHRIASHRIPGETGGYTAADTQRAALASFAYRFYRRQRRLLRFFQSTAGRYDAVKLLLHRVETRAVGGRATNDVFLPPFGQDQRTARQMPG
jgi:hypothetical protein